MAEGQQVVLLTKIAQGIQTTEKITNESSYIKSPKQRKAHNKIHVSVGTSCTQQKYWETIGKSGVFPHEARNG